MSQTKYGVDTSPDTDEKTAESPTPVLCPKCGSTLDSDLGVKLCPKCGTLPFERVKSK